MHRNRVDANSISRKSQSTFLVIFSWNKKKLKISDCNNFIQLIRDVLSLTEEQGAPRPSEDVMSQSVDTHDVYCERAWQNIMPTLRLWLMELRGLKVHSFDFNFFLNLDIPLFLLKNYIGSVYFSCTD